MKRRGHLVSERSRFSLHDLVTEAVAGVLQRPARSILTTLGTVVGVGAFVGVLGLTSSAAGQIGKQFDQLKETSVTVTEVGKAGPLADQHVAEPVHFPVDADARITALNGVAAAGVYWTVPIRQPVIGRSPTVTAASSSNQRDLPIYAASAGALQAIHPSLSTGTMINQFHDRRGERVAMLGVAAARRLGISQLSAQPAVYINNTAFTILGIFDDTQRLPQMLLGIIVPRTTAERLYGPPDPTVNPAQMIIETRLGAARLIARQAAIALRPDNPALLQAVSPPDPHSLRDKVGTDLSALFLTLAALSLAVGAVGITNTTLVAILERIGEIGIRRSLGARPRHIALQFLTESTALGLLGGLTGTALGVGVVISVAVMKRWTAIMDPLTVLPAPLIGGIIGMLAGVYPALRASRIEPIEALRR